MALILGLVDGSVLVMLVRLLRSFHRCPITVHDGVLWLRTGHKVTAPLPLSNIAGLREQWTAQDIKARSMLNMALVAWPNVVLDLKSPSRTDVEASRPSPTASTTRLVFDSLYWII